MLQYINKKDGADKKEEEPVKDPSKNIKIKVNLNRIRWQIRFEELVDKGQHSEERCTIDDNGRLWQPPYWLQRPRSYQGMCIEIRLFGVGHWCQ